MEKEKKDIGVIINKIIGYILLTPSIVSVVLFFIQLIANKSTLEAFRYNSAWTGIIEYFENGERGSGGGGFTSALPLYFGLMAIAGASLIRKK